MFRAYRLAAVILVAGCVETVPLGHECEDQSDRCVASPTTTPSPVAPAPRAPTATTRTPVVDAGRPAAPAPVVPTAAPIVDASTVAPAPRELPLFPDIANRSFETLATGSLTSRTDDRTAPWVGCAIGWNVVDRAFVAAPGGGTQAMTVMPTEGEAFMEYVRPEASDPIAPLSQRLESPLEPGRRYALRMDAHTSADVNVSLEVWSGSRPNANTASCLPLQRLGNTGRIEAGGWRPVCVSFQAPDRTNIDELMVVVNFSEAANTNARVFIDNVRNDPTCP